MAAHQQGTRQANIPLGYHYGSNYNTWNMIPNLGYQGTRNFNPQAGQQPQRNMNVKVDELLLRVTEMMQSQFGLKPKGQAFSYKRPYPEWYDQVLRIIGFQNSLSLLVRIAQVQ
jgi:hypothetical protein